MKEDGASGFVVVFVTARDVEEADRLADALVAEGLAACVNRIGPIQSTYLWKGEVNRDQEYLLVIKARRESVDTLAERVRTLHSYDVPEVIALPIVAGSRSYLEWLGEVTAPRRSPA